MPFRIFLRSFYMLLPLSANAHPIGEMVWNGWTQANYTVCICLQSEAWSCPKPSKPFAVINVIEGLKLTSLLHSHSTKAPCYCFQGMKHCMKLFSTTSSNHLKTSLPTKCFWNSYGVSVSELRSDLGHQGIVYWCEWCDAVCAPWITEHPGTPAPSCQVTWCASLQIWQIWQLAVLSTLGRASAIQLILQLSW